MNDPLVKCKDLIKFCKDNAHLTSQELYDKLYEVSASAKFKCQRSIIDVLMVTRESLGR